VVLAPDVPSPIPSSIGTLTIRNSNNQPINNAAVNITFGSGLCYCATMNFNATTNAQGVATLTLRGGGCIDNVANAAVIRANGVIIRAYNNAKSPDWAPGCDLRINLSDLLRQSPLNDPCHDYDNNGVQNLSDILLFTTGYTPAHSCN